MEIENSAALQKAEGHALRAVIMVMEREVTLPEAIDLAYWAELDALAGIELPAAPEAVRSEIFERFKELQAASNGERRGLAATLSRLLIKLHLTIVETKWSPLQRARG